MKSKPGRWPRAVLLGVACMGLSAAPPGPNGDGARKRFEAMERRLAGARGYQVEFESDVTTSLALGKVRGTLLLAPGNRMKVTVEVISPDHRQALPGDQFALVSDGKNMAVLVGPGGKPQKVEPANDRHQDTLTGWGLRIGLFFAATGHVNHGGDDDYRSLKLSDFKAAGEETVGCRRAEVIEFKVAKSGVPTRHRLWLDAETGLPLKLAVETREGFGVAETYRNWVLDPSVPDGTFALPPGLKADQEPPP